MGKESLIKSTIPKKNNEKTVKKNVKKAAAKKTNAPRKKPEKREPKEKSVQTNQLLLKKFDWPQPPLPSAIPSPTTAQMPRSKPDSDQPVPMSQEMRELLLRRFSMTDVHAAAVTSAGQSTEGTTATPESSPPPQVPAGHGFGQNGGSDKADPVVRAMIYGAIGLIAILVLLVGASYLNSNKYYLVSSNDAVEIWRGRFSPTGKQFYGVLHNYRLTDSGKPYYSKQEIFPVIFDYYLERSDDLLEIQNPPDFNSIVGYLDSARHYALSNAMKNAIDIRMNTIERLILLYKADVATNRGTRDSLELAAQYLDQAKTHADEPGQRQFIEGQLAIVKEQLATLPASASKSVPDDKTEAPAPDPGKTTPAKQQ